MNDHQKHAQLEILVLLDRFGHGFLWGVRLIIIMEAAGHILLYRSIYFMALFLWLGDVKNDLIVACERGEVAELNTVWIS